MSVCFIVDKSLSNGKVTVRLSAYDHVNFISFLSNYPPHHPGMERALRPDRFDILPDTPTAEKEFKFFLRTLENFLAV